MRKGYRIILYVVGAWVALLSVSIGSCAVKTNKLNREYTQVKIGDSKLTVVAALGEPSQIETCVGPDEKPRSSCFEVLHYSSFPYRWLLVMDGEGKVQAKYKQNRF
jgi:hypothetical protein